MIWSIVTGEYPPHEGGVSAYTRVVAMHLAAAGDEVHVWTPSSIPPADAGVAVHRLPGWFDRQARQCLDEAMRALPGSRWLVQYAPHALGWRGMNLPFARWLLARRPQQLDLMFHEVMYPVRRGEPLRQNLAGLLQRRMAALAAAAAARIFVATPRWAVILRDRVGCARPAVWLPLPGTLPVVRDEAAVIMTRRRYSAGSRLLVGHFSTYPNATRATLARLLPELMSARSDLDFLLIGRGNDDFRRTLIERYPALASRVFAAGLLDQAALSCHLSACDLLLLIYPDGACARRTTLIDALEHECAIVTCGGPSSEPLWQESGAVAFVPDEARLCDALVEMASDTARRAQYKTRAATLYRERFDPRHTVAQLRDAR